MRIDYEAREIVCSVGDLVYPQTYRRIGAERGEGFRRMWIGQDIHLARAEARAADDPFYRPEVVVSHTVEIDGWSVTVAGRIDGLSVDRERNHILVEEVKSLHFELELEALARSEKLQRHLYQLMLYALFLSRMPDYEGFSIEPQLVLIDLVGGDTEIVEAPFDQENVAATFESSLRELVARTSAERTLQIAKRQFADGLQFPFTALRPYQKEMIDAVGSAVAERETLLVSAPTGVGKTIAAIYPALRESLRLGKKLFILTPKTLQQEMAVSTLRLLNDGSFRTLRIRAKKKMCAHTEMICHEDFCPFAAGYAEKMQKNNLVAHLVDTMTYFDPSDVFEMSKAEEVCPFEVSLELIEQADVVVCDYNYIFDPYVGLKAYQQESDHEEFVLVIDEAHNLVDRGRGYYSPVLEQSSFERIREHLLTRPGCQLEGWEELIDSLREHFAELASLIEQTPGATQALCEFDRQMFLDQRVEWEKLIIRYIGWKIENRIAEEDDPLLDFYFALVRFSNLVMEQGEEFSHLVEKGREGTRLKIFCKDPSRFLRKILESSHATIAISATLEPFEFYRRTLGFPEDRCAELSLPSPFPAENRKIMLVTDVSTVWKDRSANYDPIAQHIASMAGAAAGNFLALFPSYAFLREISERLPPTGKEIIIQRNDMTDWERSSLLEALRGHSDPGHLVLAVSGGMYAEGIDYQGEMLSGVFVVGPALPTVSFEQELLKYYYDQQYGAGFEYAYLIPGMTRVVQSAGRVIRSETDVGVIALLCRRFSQPNYSRFFPSHWYSESPRELVAKRPAELIRLFFEERRNPQLRFVM
ncbi:MAG: ATP-dependent DNA helicase [Thermoanaerobaculia bacterium]